jgi:hypothetical protein
VGKRGSFDLPISIERLQRLAISALLASACGTSA